jgi:spore germination protein KC
VKSHCRIRRHPQQQVSAAILPSLRIAEKKEGSEGSDFVRDVVLDGYAVFQGHAERYITGKEARGLNWVKRGRQVGIIEVKDKDGKKLARDYRRKIKNQDGTHRWNAHITIQIEVNSNIVSSRGLPTFSGSGSLHLEEQQADVIRNEIYGVIDYAKQNHTDILGFGDKIFHQHPVQWRVQGSWSELFPKTTVYVEVESNIAVYTTL